MSKDGKQFDLRKGGRADVSDTESGRVFEAPPVSQKNPSRHLDNRQGNGVVVTGNDDNPRRAYVEPRQPERNYYRVRERKGQVVQPVQPEPEPTANFGPHSSEVKGGVNVVHDVQDGHRFALPEIADNLDHNPHLRDRQDGKIRISGNAEDSNRFYVAPPSVGLDFFTLRNAAKPTPRASAQEEVQPSRDVFAVPEGGRNSFKRSGSSGYEPPSDAISSYASGQVDNPQDPGQNDFRQVSEEARDYAAWLNPRKQTKPEPAPEKPTPSTTSTASFTVQGGVNSVKTYGPSDGFSAPKNEANYSRSLDGRFAPSKEKPEPRPAIEEEYDRLRTRGKNFNSWLDGRGF